DLGSKPLPDNPIERQQVIARYHRAVETYEGLLKSLGIDYVVFTGLEMPDRRKDERQVVNRFLIESAQGALLSTDGRTMVFGWCNPKEQAADPFRSVRLDLDRLAPAPTWPPNVPSVVLQKGVASPPVTVTGWHEFLHGPPRPALSSFESGHYEALFHDMSQPAWQDFPRPTVTALARQ